MSVNTCHLSVSGGANQGHLALEKVSPLRECHSRVAAARFAQRLPPLVWSVVRMRLDLPGLRRDLLGRATLRA